MDWKTSKHADSIRAYPCNCVGPQNGKLLCPCMMRGVVKKDGRWIRPEQDLGPVLTDLSKEPTQ